MGNYKEEERIIFIDKTKYRSELERLEGLKIYGDAKILSDSENLKRDGQKLSYNSVANHLRKTGYWETDRFIIKKTNILKSQRSK